LTYVYRNEIKQAAGDLVQYISAKITAGAIQGAAHGNPDLNPAGAPNPDLALITQQFLAGLTHAQIEQLTQAATRGALAGMLRNPNTPNLTPNPDLALVLPGLLGVPTTQMVLPQRSITNEAGSNSPAPGPNNRTLINTMVRNVVHDSVRGPATPQGPETPNRNLVDTVVQDITVNAVRGAVGAAAEPASPIQTRQERPGLVRRLLPSWLGGTSANPNPNQPTVTPRQSWWRNPFGFW
jgi:hypothetical protein